MVTPTLFPAAQLSEVGLSPEHANIDLSPCLHSPMFAPLEANLWRLPVILPVDVLPRNSLQNKVAPISLFQNQWPQMGDQVPPWYISAWPFVGEILAMWSRVGGNDLLSVMLLFADQICVSAGTERG